MKTAKKRQQQPPCQGCQHSPPRIGQRNELVMWLVKEIGPALYDGFGGINAGSIHAALDIYDVPNEDRQWIFRRIMIFLAAKKAKDGEQSRANHPG